MLLEWDWHETDDIYYFDIILTLSLAHTVQYFTYITVLRVARETSQGKPERFALFKIKTATRSDFKSRLLMHYMSDARAESR